MENPSFLASRRRGLSLALRLAALSGPHRLIGGLGALALAGCATGPSGLLQRLPSDLSPAVELDDTPFFTQTAYQCGPAALATVLGAAGVAVQPEALAKTIFLPSRQGTLQLEMLTGARRQGRVPVRLPGTLEALFRELGDGRPVVVLLNLGLDVAPVWHYAVLVGYSMERQEVTLRSGIVRRYPLPMALFENTWSRADAWAFVVMPPGRWPPTAQEPAIVEACIGFERAAPPATALRVYASASWQWRDNLALTMGLGNTAYAAGNKVLAADSFQTAARKHRSAPAWINLARTLLDAGLPDSAWRVALEAEYLNDPAWRAETTSVLRDVNQVRLARLAPPAPAPAPALPETVPEAVSP